MSRIRGESHCRAVALLALTCSMLATLVHSATATSSADKPCPADAGWSDPARPAHVYANTWYVGTCGVSAILVTSAKGHVLIDGATEKAAPLIEANIRALGFRVEDIRYLLNSHEHLDHAGGLARLAKDSGATVIAREPAAKTLERGASDNSDPQFGLIGSIPPIANIRRIADQEPVTLGDLVSRPRHSRPYRRLHQLDLDFLRNGQCRSRSTLTRLRDSADVIDSATMQPTPACSTPSARRCRESPRSLRHT